MNKRILLLSALLFVFAAYVNLYPFHGSVPAKKELTGFPLRSNGWSGLDLELSDPELQKLKVTEYLSREYAKDGKRVGLYIGYYREQKEGAQIHSPKHCLPGSGWLNLSERTRTLQIPGSGPVRCVEAVYRKGDNEQMFIYWYKMKGCYVVGDYSLKWHMILNSLRYGRNDAAFVRLSTRQSEGPEGGARVLEAYLRDFMPLLRGYLPE